MTGCQTGHTFPVNSVTVQHMERPERKISLPTAEQFEEMTRSIRTLIDGINDDGVKNHCSEFARTGFRALLRIKQLNPEMAQLAELAAYSLMAVTQYVAIDQNEKHTHPERVASRKHKPTDGYKETARQLAQSIAFKHWKEDDEQKLHINDMSLYVWGKMIEMHYVEFLPDDYRDMQEWIASVAPEYALRPVPAPQPAQHGDNDAFVLAAG